MSLLKSKSFWNGVLAAVIISAVCASSMAFAPEGMRLWKPYQPEQFGGQRRDADGVYGSVSAIIWKVDSPRNINNDNVDPTGSIRTNFIDTDFGLGTRVTFGNRLGHWGWLVRGYGISGLGGSLDREGYSWFRPAATPPYPRVIRVINNPTGGGFAWDIVEGVVDYISDIKNVMNGKTKLSTSVDIIDLELLGTYRAHPFKWGNLELSAGARYWDFKDRLQLSHEVTNNVYAYSYYEGAAFSAADSFTIIVANTRGELETVGINNSSNNNNRLNNDPEPLILTVEDMYKRQARNTIVGPQVGMSVSRRNKRWTFGADAAFIAGINNQSFRYYQGTEVRFGAINRYNQSNNSSGNRGGSGDDASNLSVPQLLALEFGTISPVVTAMGRARRTVFSPGADMQLWTKWQWTDAVGIKLGFDSTIFNRIVRGEDIYVVDPPALSTALPTLAINSKGRTVITYGINIGLEIKR